MTRLVRIEVGSSPRLVDGDECYHIGEYQARGTFQAGETNQLITNLKIPVPVPAHRLKYKARAIATCGDMLAQVLNHEFLRDRVTLVPMPGSYPVGHPEHDDRIEKVCRRLGQRISGGVDIRVALETTAARCPQHSRSTRATVAELLATMRLSPSMGTGALKPCALVIDDVFTLGTSFRAARTLLLTAPGVQRIVGVAIARTVWPDPASEFEDE